MFYQKQNKEKNMKHCRIEEHTAGWNKILQFFPFINKGEKNGIKYKSIRTGNELIIKSKKHEWKELMIELKPKL